MKRAHAAVAVAFTLVGGFLIFAAARSFFLFGPWSSNPSPPPFSTTSAVVALVAGVILVGSAVAFARRGDATLWGVVGVLAAIFGLAGLVVMSVVESFTGALVITVWLRSNGARPPSPFQGMSALAHPAASPSTSMRQWLRYGARPEADAMNAKL